MRTRKYTTGSMMIALTILAVVCVMILYSRNVYNNPPRPNLLPRVDLDYLIRHKILVPGWRPAKNASNGHSRDGREIKKEVHFRMRERPDRIRREKQHQSTWVSNDGFNGKDGLLRNVSLDDLIHMSENKGLDAKEFSQWAKTLLGKNRTQHFFMPQFYERSSNICKENPELIILMPTSGELQFSRELIRQTWASSIYKIMDWPGGDIVLRTKLVFIIGTEGLSYYRKTAVKKEAQIYNDIVAAKFVDSYRNLTLKMLVGLNWVSLYCKNSKFVLKCDVDTFINLPLMARLLVHVSSSVPRFIIGHKHRLTLPPVVRSGKWMVNQTDYPFPFFPPYHIGHSYAMSAEIVPKMASIARYIPIIPAEDAHITGILARILKIPRIHFTGFAHLDKPIKSCKLVHNKEVSATRMSLGRILITWRFFLLNTCPATDPPIQNDEFINLQLDNWCEKCHRIKLRDFLQNNKTNQ